MVYLDVNGNGQYDSSDPHATTRLLPRSGWSIASSDWSSAVLRVDPDASGNANGTAVVQPGYGGCFLRDTRADPANPTLVRLQYSLSAPAGCTGVSPLTTVLSYAMELDPSSGLEAVRQKLERYMNLRVSTLTLCVDDANAYVALPGNSPENQDGIGIRNKEYELTDTINAACGDVMADATASTFQINSCVASKLSEIAQAVVSTAV